ncbi:class I SAM-dependent methyltransferase [Coraliomargarita akajimensis]|uniref:Putative rRNA methylase n=1 Tax=Coraliomargarita akajimensis (strain DSM 45221 / IAM 15411 / JCM 23193 / KCTC 12865 / 04OKA010-24) TaxID=583355 RepID=D5EM54_CORAD|nr:class I SAM-dependent methyltransferase [Coraliomargarita akajimensis]ADE55214.1 putative rRNA methylase [Coraliomargarita akajimensis DSM 45221]
MRLTERAHQTLEQLLSPGDLAIDATAGNGHDTLKLAQLVGPTGKVMAIDIQAQAIESTRERLSAAGLQNVELIQQDHATALRQLVDSYRGNIRAITFNLGYLPGSDKSVQTSENSTLPALDASLQLLSATGKLFITAYRGHDGGQQEATAVEKWIQQQNRTTECFEPKIIGDRIPPILWVLSK